MNQCEKRTIRFYMGRHKIEILFTDGKKSMVHHLENGYVGNSDIGYKEVRKGRIDICLTRHCHRMRKEERERFWKHG